MDIFVNNKLQPFTGNLRIPIALICCDYNLFQLIKPIGLFTMIFDIWCIKTLLYHNKTTFTEEEVFLFRSIFCYCY